MINAIKDSIFTVEDGLMVIKLDQMVIWNSFLAAHPDFEDIDFIEYVRGARKHAMEEGYKIKKIVFVDYSSLEIMGIPIKFESEVAE